MWFAYNDEDYVLRDVSFEVAPGERVGDRRRDGRRQVDDHQPAAAVLRRRARPDPVDGVDIREMELDELRALFSLVLQDVHLFSGTIAGNIRLGNDRDHATRTCGAPRRRCTPIASSSGCRPGSTAAVAERGATLSVGQKQLLSFARALAFDPRILVLDEATSSVDTETELLIRDALHVLMAGRTTIAIAHRLSTIQDMDKILVLHKGQLREIGHPPGAARAARDLLQAVSAAVQGSGSGGAKWLPTGRNAGDHRWVDVRIEPCLGLHCLGSPAAGGSRSRLDRRRISGAAGGAAAVSVARGGR